MSEITRDLNGLMSSKGIADVFAFEGGKYLNVNLWLFHDMISSQTVVEYLLQRTENDSNKCVW